MLLASYDLDRRLAFCHVASWALRQVDAEQKAAGIISLGGILKKSKTLLVLWDHTYIEAGTEPLGPPGPKVGNITYLEPWGSSGTQCTFVQKPQGRLSLAPSA